MLAPTRASKSALLALSLLVPLSPIRAGDTPSPTKEWTFLIFMNADNNLDPNGVKDMNEMETVGSTDKINIVTQLDREGDTGTWRYLVQKDDKPNEITTPIVETMPEQDMGSPDTLKAFVQWGMQKYPAKHYMVAIWNHGSGWEKRSNRFGTKGVSYDDTSGNHLSVGQIGTVMREIQAARGGQKVDIIGYDACLMQMVEVAGECADSCLYQVASEETEPLDGWAYGEWLTQVAAHPEWDGAKVGSVLVDTYKASYSGGSQGNDTTTQSVIDLGKLADLQAKADAFSAALLADAAQKPKITEAAEASQAYASNDHKDIADFIDQVTQRINTQPVTEAAAALKTALSGVVINSAYTGSSLEKSTGLAVWVPSYTSASTMDSYKQLAWAKSSQWDEFVGVLTSSGSAIVADLLRTESNGLASDVSTLAMGLTSPADRNLVLSSRKAHPKSSAIRDLLRTLQARALQSN
jgi:hypothetical protein